MLNDWEVEKLKMAIERAVLAALEEHDRLKTARKREREFRSLEAWTQAGEVHLASMGEVNES